MKKKNDNQVNLYRCFAKNAKFAKYHGFTLIELLVVISIIALLMSILMPALGKARDLAKAVVCRSNQKNILYGTELYTQDNKDVFPDTEASVYLIGEQSQEVGDEVSTIWSCPTTRPRNRMTNLLGQQAYNTDELFKYFDREILVWKEGDPAPPISDIYVHYGINGLTDPQSSYPSQGPKKRTNFKMPSEILYVLDANWCQLWTDDSSDNSRLRVENRHGGLKSLNVGYMDGHVGKMEFPIEYGRDERDARKRLFRR